MSYHLDKISEKKVRRSEQTTPGHSEKLCAKAASGNADMVMLDLEDACAVSQKVDARKVVGKALAENDWGQKIRGFRANNIRTIWCLDDIIEVLTIARDAVDVIVIPKVYGPEEIHYYDFLFNQLEYKLNMKKQVKFEVLIESAAAALKAYDIAKASPRMDALIFGIADYAGDVNARVMKGDEQFQVFHWAKSQVVTAARAALIDSIDNVTLDYKDLDQVRKDAVNARNMGFDGKWCIHPTHVEVVNEVFTPSDEEIKRATEIIGAYDKADKEQGLGAITFGTEMVDAATLRVERWKLSIARRVGKIRA